MNGELSGEKNETVYVRNETAKQLQSITRKAPPMQFDTADVAFSFIMLICGFLYCNLINFVSMGLGVTIFTAVLCIAALIYFKNGALGQTKTSLPLLGLILVSGAGFTLFDGPVIKFLNFIFLTFCFIYWICTSAKLRLEERLSFYFLSDMLRQTFSVPFYNLTACFGGIRQVFSKSGKGKGFLSGVLGIVFFLPVLIIVITLLNDADAAFENLMEQFRFSVSENMLIYIRDILFGIPVACYLYGLLYGSRHRRCAETATIESVNEQIKSFRVIPETAVYSALAALNLIYVVFFLVQASYLFSAFQNSLPESMTYAEYARRGFFELCAVSGINFGVIAFAHLIAKREKPKVLKFYTVALCIFTLMLIGTAMSKMGMYISYYGLTQMRVYTSWFMIVLLFLFAIILLRQMKAFNGTRISVIGCVVLFLLLSFGNVDGMIAKYNIGRYQQGTLENLDVKAFYELSDGAVPYLYGLYQETDDPVLKYRLEKVICKPRYGIDAGDQTFRDFNLQHYKAEQIRRAI